MMYSNIPLAQSIVSACKEQGIARVVISPGSRNAPLTLSFLADPFFKCYSIVDERSAAFFAMGMAQQEQKGVALICTSGSALLNYYPAIAEAFYSQIPLLVISADRPKYLIDKGYGQTIRQEGVFDQHISYSATLLQDASHATESYQSFMPLEDQLTQQHINIENNKLLAKACSILELNQRPVHLNAPFEEPLYGTTTFLPLKQQTANKAPTISKIPNSVGTLWSNAQKIILLVGVCPPSGPNALNKDTVEMLSADPRVLVFTETTSNINNTSFIDSIDNLFAPLESHSLSQSIFTAFKPDLLISIGGAVVSKKIKSFLNIYKPACHIQLGNDLVNNPFFTKFIQLNIPINIFFENLKQYPSVKQSNIGFKDKALVYKSLYKAHIENYAAAAEFSDFKAFYMLLKALPRNIQLQLANSATIRYAQLFSIDPSIQVFCNRGTSGIDGSTSTAIGAAVTSTKQTVFVTGDLSFFYDSNGLWNQYIPKNFRIILINNQGGGIFRVLPGKTDTENFDTYFETVHHLQASQLCALHAVSHSLVSNEHSLESALKDFFNKGDSPRVLEIKTPRKTNDLVLNDFFKSLSAQY